MATENKVDIDDVIEAAVQKGIVREDFSCSKDVQNILESFKDVFDDQIGTERKIERLTCKSKRLILS